MSENLSPTARAWFNHVTGSDSINAIAKRSGIHQASLNRQVANGRISAENTVAIARAYRVNVLDSLIAQGLLTYDDIRTAAGDVALAAASDDRLVEEIARRLPEASDLSPLKRPTYLHASDSQTQEAP